jgi:3' terminal RNA ribose 2'-O-methyltransferase Hen1
VLLTLTSTAPRATDLGFLLHKHPDRVQRFTVSTGEAHVFYPEATDERCTAALLLEVDPVALVRDKRFRADGLALGQYVNDRPYAASSMLATALGKVFATALAGRCAGHEELVERPLPLTVRVPSLPTDGGAALVRALLEPLGWAVDAREVSLTEEAPAWGSAPYVDLTLTGEHTVQAALSHLYVLLPVLDPARRFWVGSEAADKMIRTSGEWLARHPDRDLITRRYLRGRHAMITDATERLAALDGSEHDDVVDDEQVAEVRRPLAVLRKAAVVAVLRELGARRVVDLGCGEGALLRELVKEPTFTEVLGVDVAARTLRLAARRLGLDRMPDSQRARIALKHSSLSYRDDDLVDKDAIVLMEVIEHVEPDRLPTLERNVFVHARPAAVVVTTPNAEHNVVYEDMPAGTMRHPDHRFEWTRAELAAWSERVADEHGYAVVFRPVGPEHPVHGPATQMAVFTRGATAVNGVVPRATTEGAA